jgi:hypothetical protein
MEFINQLIDLKNHSKAAFKYAQLKFISNDNKLFEYEAAREQNSKFGKDHFSDRIGVTERFIVNDKVIFDENSGRIRYSDGMFSFTGYPVDFFKFWTFNHLNPSFVKYNLPDNLSCIDNPGMLDAEIDNGMLLWTFPDTLSFLDDIFRELEVALDFEPIDDLKNTSTDFILEKLKIQEKIIDNLRTFTTIKDIRFNNNLNLYQEEKSLIIENVKLDFKINDTWLPWSQLSDGTKRLFYIIAEITFTKGLALIEEPELGIHPHQFNLLMDFLKEQSEEKQIIISTHSPKALDHLSPEELNNILIAYYDLEKGTQIRHLTEKEVKKAQKYIKEVGFFSDYWLLSDLE